LRHEICIGYTGRKKAFAKELFKTISFIKNVKAIQPNEITNPVILQSISDYETGKIKPTPFSVKSGVTTQL
jgi:hypothetical protein